jgi:hypothetical protein
MAKAKDDKVGYFKRSILNVLKIKSENLSIILYNTTQSNSQYFSVSSLKFQALSINSLE